MEKVIVSDEGIIENILTLNYTIETCFIEYINNVILKNNDPKYTFSIDYKRIKRRCLEFLHFHDINSVGFSSLEEIRKAFTIADSMRTGANNMGYGIFSPLTIEGGENDALNLFIQKKKNGKSLYGIIHYISDTREIKTRVGEYKDSKISIKNEGESLTKHVDISDLEIENGTNSIWILGNNLSFNDECQEKDAISIIKCIKGVFSKSKKEDSLIENEYYEHISVNQVNLQYKLGVMYNDVLENKTIHYGNGKMVIPINILGNDLEEERKKVFFVQSVLVNSKNAASKERKYKIKEKEDEEWKKFNESNAIGEVWDSNGTGNLRNNNSESCTIHIHCLPSPQDGDSTYTREEMRKERLIYVKLDGIIIFQEEYGMHAYDEIRTVIELTNCSDNEVSSFISLNPNKSNSKLNHEFKKKIVSLIKKTTKRDYFGKLLKKDSNKSSKIPKKLCEQVWINTFGKPPTFPCSIAWCSEEISCFDYQTGHNIPLSKGGETTLENLLPICARCNTSMGNQYTIDEWNKKGKGESHTSDWCMDRCV